MQVSTKELKTLDELFARSIDSIKRTDLYLTFLGSQMEEEQTVFTEARGAIKELIDRSE